MSGGWKTPKVQTLQNQFCLLINSSICPFANNGAKQLFTASATIYDVSKWWSVVSYFTSDSYILKAGVPPATELQHSSNHTIIITDYNQDNDDLKDCHDEGEH